MERNNRSGGDRNKRHQELDPENLIFGTRAVIEAVAAGKEIDKIILQKGLSNQLFSELRKAIQGLDIPLQFVPPEKLSRITSKNHQGVVAFVAQVTYYEVEDMLAQVFEKGKTPLVLILIELQMYVISVPLLVVLIVLG